MTSAGKRLSPAGGMKLNLDAMYGEYFPKIYNYVFCRILHRQNAEDIVSAVFLKVVENFDTYNQDKASFATWIYRIARNTLIDFYRTHKDAISLDGDDENIYVPVDFDEESKLIENEDRKALYTALSKMDARTREIIALKYYGEMSIRDISAMLNINESTASTIHTRGIKKLRQLFGDEFKEEI